MWYTDLAEAGRLPDWLIRGALHLSLGYTARNLDRQPIEARDAERRSLLARLRSVPIAIDTADPNAQHCEVPGALYATIQGVTTLAAAEETMLALTCDRADLQDGQDILELDCRRGSLTLWMAEHYPHSTITAMSSSRTQREYIQAQAAARGLDNVTALTADMVTFGADDSHDGRYDRVASVEMDEHMKNYARLMARTFFQRRHHARCVTAAAFPARPGADRAVARRGRHYARTLRAWLDRLDTQRLAVERIMAETYGQDHVRLRGTVAPVPHRLRGELWLAARPRVSLLPVPL